MLVLKSTFLLSSPEFQKKNVLSSRHFCIFTWNRWLVCFLPLEPFYYSFSDTAIAVHYGSWYLFLLYTCLYIFPRSVHKVYQCILVYTKINVNVICKNLTHSKFTKIYFPWSFLYSFHRRIWSESLKIKLRFFKARLKFVSKVSISLKFMPLFLF